MNLREIILQSIESLLRNRLRSGLTMLGIAWGLVTVVLLLSYGQSLGKEVLNAFLGIGNNVIMTFGGQTSMQAGGQRAGKKVHLDYADLEAMRHDVPFVKEVSGEVDDTLAFKYGNRIVNLNIKAVELPYGDMRKLNVAQGRYFEADDFTEHRHVAIFGPVAARKLFSGLPPVGQDVTIEDDTFAGATWQGRVVRVSDWFAEKRNKIFEPFMVNDVRTLECLIEVTSAGRPLRIGQRVRVKIKQSS